MGGGLVAALTAACGDEAQVDFAELPGGTQALDEQIATEASAELRIHEPPSMLKARLSPATFGLKGDDDQLVIEVTSSLDEDAELLFLVRALDESQRIVKVVSAGVLLAREQRTVGVRFGDLGVQRNAIEVAGVLSLYPMLATESGGRSGVQLPALRLSYHPEGSRLRAYDAVSRKIDHRGGALSEGARSAAGSGANEVLPGYGGPRAVPEHELPPEPDPDHAALAGVSP